MQPSSATPPAITMAATPGSTIQMVRTRRPPARRGHAAGFTCDKMNDTPRLRGATGNTRGVNLWLDESACDGSDAKLHLGDVWEPATKPGSTRPASGDTTPGSVIQRVIRIVKEPCSVIQQATVVGTDPTLGDAAGVHMAADPAWRSTQRHAGIKLGLTNPGRHPGRGSRQTEVGAPAPAVGSLPAKWCGH